VTVAQLAAEVLPVARPAVVMLFALLALVAVVRARHDAAAGRWAATAFASLAGVLLIEWIGDTFGVETPAWLTRIEIVAFLTFPYQLLRFTASFRAFPRRLEIAAATAAVCVTAATLALHSTGTGDVGPGGVAAFVTILLPYWLLISVVPVVSLWRAGRGQPTVARRRMRLMSAATALLGIALLMALASRTSAPVQLSAQVIALVSGTVFALGFSPPQAVRLSWRRADEQELQASIAAVLRAESVEELIRVLLPPTVRLVGGGGGAVIDPRGRVVATHGETPPAEGGQAPTPRSAAARQVVPLGDRHGELVVWTSPYIPFFGRDEIDLLATMGGIATLALERTALLDDERGRRTALERAQHETERAREEAERAREEAERAREEATEANQAKNAFLSRMSHELRTPLNAILGFGQLLQTSTLDDDDREGVSHIIKAGRHLLALINDVLDLSRIEAGMMTMSLEPVHTGEVIGDAVNLIQPLADSRSIRLISDPRHCDTYVITDHQRCRQSLLNLLSNAIKYNHDGGDVTIRCERSDDATLRISVRDSGPGIDPVRRARLFEPFERLGAEESGVEGTGLGLALTQQLVERMGATMGVDTAPGQGSTFWIDLPITERPAAVNAPVAAARPSQAAGDRTLLLVEDNLVNLRVVEAMLRRVPGVTVLPAMQGSLAIELAYEHRPDVIVLDLHLPDMSGRQVLQRLQADSRTHGIPVVIASADATPGRVRQLLAEGAFAYLTKPLDLGQFLDVVTAAIARRDEVGVRTATAGREPIA
jgi:signal transduction histidine kinase/CheY-like chemotaxis protein